MKDVRFLIEDEDGKMACPVDCIESPKMAYGIVYNLSKVIDNNTIIAVTWKSENDDVSFYIIAKKGKSND